MGRKANIEKLIVANPVNKGLDYAFIEGIIRDITLKHFPEVVTITKIEHTSHKRRVGKHHSTFIYGYFVSGTKKDGTPIRKHLIYSSHSDASRLVAFTHMQLFQAAGFNADHTYMSIVPLEYVPEIKALVYEAIDGQTLYELMGSHPANALYPIVHQVALWTRKFHAFKLSDKDLATIPLATSSTMNWKVDEFQADVEKADQQQGEKLRYFTATFFALEKKLHEHLPPRLIYGDLHPENVITQTLDPKTLTLIDFTDIARGDQMRDIGTFMQQLHFMGTQFYSQEETQKLKHYFIEQYFQKPLDQLEQEFFDRINLYQAWSSLRGFVYFFYQPDYREKSYGLLEDAWRYLYFAGHAMRTIDLAY